MGEQSELLRVVEALKARGFKLTPQRQEILRVLAEAEKPLNAREIEERLHRRFPSVGRGTVYRTLETLRSVGLLEETFFEGSRHFVLAQKHRHHLICLRCGRIFSFPCCFSECLSRVLDSFPDFEVKSHVFAIYGYCGSCREALSGGERR
ncbi:ferric uptake regulator, Fur family [Ammonifex degensii KC4]|uniref:Ferric uptake regulator, Fur family n=1 Tax=Ammonifex degensii (strain DSM 10501 / KC4) TaxID=429009 RepID=C9R7P8_AMMDK|nr:transcriptional repressor [Ammonifex degensii]ACX52327.1 ferric uptake regulator, Fur family [Ammonifex degensii KC4]